MASRGFTLKDEERRRQLTIAALAAGLVISTLPVTNERALFSPFADLPLLGEFSPVAYAMFTGFGPGGGGRFPGGMGGPLGPRAGGPPVGGTPTAFAAPLPPAGPTAAAPPAPPAPPVANFARPIDGPFGSTTPGSPISQGFGPGDALGVPGGPGPISIVPGNALPTPTTPVPEPAAWAMLMLGFATIGGLLRRRYHIARRVRSTGVSEG